MLRLLFFSHDLLLQLCFDELVVLELFLMDLQRAHLEDARVALVALNIRHFLLLLLQLAHHLFFEQNLRLQLVLSRFAILRPAQVLLPAPRVDIVLDAALVLRNMLIVNDLLLHALDESLERIKLCLCLHLPESAHRGLLLFEFWECTVHGTLDILLDQS